MKWRWPLFALAVALIYLLSAYILRNFVVLPSFERLERDEATKDFSRCIDALNREVQALGSTNTDYSVWDDTYDFVESRNQAYLSSNYRWPFVEEKVRVNLVCICGPHGEPIWETGRYPGQTDILKMTELLGTSSFQRLLDGKAPQTQGLVNTHRGPLIVASHSILPSSGEGVPRGTLLMGRFLTQEVVTNLTRQTHVRFMLDDVADAASADNQNISFQILDRDRALVRGCVEGLTATDRIAVAAEIPRTIMARGREAALTTEITLAVGAVLIGLLGGLLLHRTLRAEALSKALGESEERFKLAIAGANLGTWDWHVPSGELRFNLRFVEMLGYHPEDLEPHIRAWEQLIHPDDHSTVMRVIQEHLDRKTPLYHIEYRLHQRSGNWIWVLSTGRVMARDADGKALRVCGTQLDVTERREAEARRQRAEAQAWRAQKVESLGVLAGGIAHDFNNLLVGIMGNADLALRETSPKSQAHENLADIQMAARRAADLCRQMLAYAGRGQFVVEPIDLNLVVEEMLRMLGLSLSKHAQLECQLDEQLPQIQADGTQIRQVVMNLLTNASDAMEHKRGTIVISTGAFDCTREYLSEACAGQDLVEGRYVFVEVRDDGRGMSPDVQARMFDPFFTTKFTGQGLGMAAVLGIVRGHHGGIHIRSTTGRGTTIRIFFPALSSFAAPSKPPAQPETVWKGQGTVLVVDDDSIVRQVAEQMLRIMGFNVLQAAGGHEAVDVCRQHGTDLTCVLLDLAMPGLDGEQTYEALRTVCPDVTVVMSSGFSEKEVTERFKGKGVAGFIQKPYELDALQDKLRAILG